MQGTHGKCGEVSLLVALVGKFYRHVVHKANMTDILGCITVPQVKRENLEQTERSDVSHGSA